MRERTWKARRDKLLAEEAGKPVRYWYLSFADAGFKGAIIVRARGFTSAVHLTHDLGINPGGQVQGYEIPPDLEQKIPPDSVNRLLSKDELEKLFGA